MIDNYNPLFYYWKKARGLGREDLIERTLIKEEDLKFLEDLVKNENRISLEMLINEIARAVSDRIDSEIAKEALKAYGIPMDGKEAKVLLARILAGWIIEAGEIRGIIKLRF